MSLFEKEDEQRRREVQPLAARMRPRTLDEFVGQEHFLGEGKILRRLIRADRLGSVIFYGPPGTGKTTLARILATETKSVFQQISAVTSGVKELREIIDGAARRLLASGQKTVLFIDEIHRFNRAQQDVLLPHVEEGGLVFVGATTENPFFSMTSALVSRSRVFEFLPLTPEHIKVIVRRALTDRERGLGNYEVIMEEEALEFLAQACEGDARRALSALEVAVLSSETFPLRLTRQLMEDSLQRKAIVYDRQGDAHYDTISALIKSIRGSDPDAATYWLAKMLEAGEDVRFIARRLMILASEDIGNADPTALPLAVAAAHACEMIGLPECRLNLAQVVIYLACAPKSNAVIKAIDEALEDIRSGRVLPVPVHLRDANYPGAKRLGHGQGYVYSQEEPDAIAEQDYLGVDKTYYVPSDRGFEKELKARLEVIRERLGRANKKISDLPDASTSSLPEGSSSPPRLRKARKTKENQS
ncbi:MAG: replication-associated recombination protein A [Thermogutta sp.]|nr:replication-associated recombination protein A [Thermogutta sp.]HPU06735.1 replication-associated recombination protein A [Thermogutta sp.]HQF12871.1 replication-associated recombination protein A [Thermogutta sp.]